MCHLFDNASLAALVGAAAAFLLVVANDRRRDRHAAKKLLPGLLGRLRTLLESRITGATAGLQSLDTTPTMRDIGLRFPVNRIERYVDLGAAHLSDRESMALDNLIFWMQESDRLNRVCLETLDQIDLAKSSETTLGEFNRRLGLTQYLRDRYGEEIYLLKKIDELIAAYLAGTLNQRGGILKAAAPDG